MRALVVLVVCLWCGVAGAGEIVVDFEAAADASALVEGDDIAGRFDEWHVSFYVPGEVSGPFIATGGRPCTAFEVYRPGFGIRCDLAVSGVNVLTDGGRAFRELGASFSHPTSEVSLSLIDFGDCVGRPLGTLLWVELAALDLYGNVVDTDALSIPRHAAGSAWDGNVMALSVSGSDIYGVETRGAARDCGKAVDDVRFVLQDLDGDGIIDGEDLCPGTPAGALVDADGCDVDALCPCDGDWANHGGYVSCVSGAANALVADGLLDEVGHGEVVSAAAGADCPPP